MKQRTLTVELCLESARRFSIKSDWARADYASYHGAKKRGWFEVCTAHMVKGITSPVGRKCKRWTFQECLRDALKFSTVPDWKRELRRSWSFAKTHGWLSTCTAHMTKKEKNVWWKRTYTLESCKASATPFKKLRDWRRSDSGSYKEALTRGWLPQCVAHMDYHPKIKHTREEILQDAAKYSSIKAWGRFSPKLYHAARWNGWDTEAAVHMVSDCYSDAELRALKFCAYRIETSDHWRYYGITMNPERRKKQHLVFGSAVARHLRKNPGVTFSFEIVKRDLNGLEAIALEQELISTDKTPLLNRNAGGTLHGASRADLKRSILVNVSG
jgi:predicted GIY-YIG superfamily endonuclease